MLLTPDEMGAVNCAGVASGGLGLDMIEAAGSAGSAVGRVDGTALAMVEAIIENRSTICAIDVPSGLDGASGSVLGSAAQPPRAVVRPADAGTRTVRGGLRVCLAPRCRCLGLWARSNRRGPPDRAAGGVASARRSVMVGFASTDQERGSANLARGVGPGPLSAGTRTLVIVGHTG